MKIQERYATAVRSSCLTVDERTTYSDTDVLGAMGLASREHPLAVALERLFYGDNTASEDLLNILTEMLQGKAPSLQTRISASVARDMARACLAWHRDGTCKACGGHGKQLIPGTKTHSERPCHACKPSPNAATGTGKVPFERSFHPERRPLAAWLVSEMQREQAKAGPAAMKRLAPSLNLG